MASGFDLATAYVQIVPSTEGIGGKITSALSGEASSAGDSAGDKAGSSFVSKLKTAIVGAGIATAVKGAVDTVANAINSVASAGDEIDKTSQKLGVSASEYQALAFAANHCGFSTSTFSTAVKKLQQSGYEGTLTDYLDSLMEIEDPTERAAAAQEMLGEKVANEMAAYINGGQTMSEYGEQLEALGGMMSDDAVAASAAYEDALTDMQIAMSGAKNEMVAELLPGITDVMNGIAKVASGDSSGFELIKQGALNFVETIGEVGSQMLEKGGELVGMLVEGIVTGLPGLLENGLALVEGFSESIGSNLPSLVSSGVSMINTVVSGIMANLPTILASGGRIISNLLSGIWNSLPALLSGGVKMITTIVTGIGNSLPQLLSSAGAAVGKFVAGLVQNLPQILATGIQLLGRLVAGILSAIGQLPSAALQCINSFKGAFNGINWSSVGQNIISGIARGISGAAGQIASAARQAAENALQAAKNFLGIKSPSRVFRDQVGKMVSAGWAQGITANAGAVYDSIANISDNALGYASSSLSSTMDGFGSNTVSSRSSNNTVIELLERIAEKDNNLYIGNRKMTDTLERLGVAFA